MNITTRLAGLGFVALGAMTLGCGGKSALDAGASVGAGGGGAGAGGAESAGSAMPSTSASSGEPSCSKGAMSQLPGTELGRSLGITGALDNLFFTATDDVTGTVVRTPRGGGSSQILAQVASPHLFRIAADGESVFFIGDGTLSRVPADGSGMAVTLPAPGARDLALDASYVYWAGDKTVSRAPKAGGPATVIATSPHAVLGLAVDATSVYYVTQFASGGLQGELVRADLAGGVPTVLASGHFGSSIAEDADSVYFIEGTDTGMAIGKVAKSGGAKSTLVEAEGTGFDVVIAGASAYFTKAAGLLSTRSLFEVPTSGGAATLLSDDTMSPLGITIDATYVYTTSGATVGPHPIYRICR
jgi:hypothetical protein